MADDLGGSHIVTLWAVPRSVSTAFEKTFSRRGDTRIVHEPFTDRYYFSAQARSHRYGYQPAKLGYDTAAAVHEILADPAPIVFVKDLAFQAEPYLPDDFLRRATNTFIVRHPSVVLESLRRLKPDFTEDEFGFEPLARLFRQVIDGLGQEPILIEGDRFRESPGTQLREYCRRVRVDFDPVMLSWPDGRIRSWAEHEQQSQAKWHWTLEHSQGIIPPRRPAVPDVRRDRADIVRRAEKIYEELRAYML